MAGQAQYLSSQHSVGPNLVRHSGSSAQRPLPFLPQQAAPSGRRMRSTCVCHAAAPSTRQTVEDRSRQQVPILNNNIAGSISWSHQLQDLQQEGCPAEESRQDEASWCPSQGWRQLPHHLPKQKLWNRLRQEAKLDAGKEPALASFLHSTILAHKTLEHSMAFILANKLSSRTLLGTQLMRMIQDAYERDATILEAGMADLQAVYDRDPACETYLQCLLYLKGFQAIQCQRVAHWLWTHGRRTLAVVLQSRVSEVMHVDIHPAARLGRGLMIDHATGVVIGETARVGDNVSILHHVTLGGSGTGTGLRHPHIDHGVLLGAGVSVLGPIHVGAGTKVGAGSVVVTDLPNHCVAVGVPARIIRQNCVREPSLDMDAVADFTPDYQI